MHSGVSGRLVAPVYAAHSLSPTPNDLHINDLSRSNVIKSFARPKENDFQTPQISSFEDRRNQRRRVLSRLARSSEAGGG